MKILFLVVAGDVTRFSVGSQSGVVRLRGAADTWDYETDPNSFTVRVRATDFPGGAPRLTVSLDMNKVSCKTWLTSFVEGKR